ncbi:MAG: hypothetical protein J6X84_06865 [Treponema sp.]|nr:hypothetical protein [Treponema sp.]
MKVFICSLQIEISQIISDHLSNKGNLCFTFSSQQDLSDAIHSMTKMPDLLILDYLLYNHELFNLNQYMDLLNIKVPVIFYNDPCLVRSTRSEHWLTELELLHSNFIQTDFSDFKPILSDLEELIESKEFKPYISLLQEPKPLPRHFIKDQYTLQYLKENSDDCIYQFLERSHIPNNLFYLLSVLQKNKEIELTLKDIVEIYKKDGHKITEESLKVHISNLKKQIRNDKKCSFLIINDEGYYRFVRYKV